MVGIWLKNLTIRTQKLVTAAGYMLFRPSKLVVFVDRADKCNVKCNSRAGTSRRGRRPSRERSSRVQTNRIIISVSIGGPAASPAAGTNATRNSNKRTTPSTAYFLYTDSLQWGRNKHSQSSCRSGTNRFPHVRARQPHCR